MASRWRRWARISFALDLLLGVKVVVAAQDPVGPSIADQGCGSPPNLLSGAADATPPPTVDERNRAVSMNKTRDDVPTGSGRGRARERSIQVRAGCSGGRADRRHNAGARPHDHESPLGGSKDMPHRTIKADRDRPDNEYWPGASRSSRFRR